MTKFGNVAPNICGSSVCNLLHVTIPATTILRWRRGVLGNLWIPGNYYHSPLHKVCTWWQSHTIDEAYFMHWRLLAFVRPTYPSKPTNTETTSLVLNLSTRYHQLQAPAALPHGLKASATTELWVTWTPKPVRILWTQSQSATPAGNRLLYVHLPSTRCECRGSTSNLNTALSTIRLPPPYRWPSRPKRRIFLRITLINEKYLWVSGSHFQERSRRQTNRTTLFNTRRCLNCSKSYF